MHRVRIDNDIYYDAHAHKFGLYSECNHKHVRIVHPLTDSMKYRVDEGIALLLQRLWSYNYETTRSCQGDDGGNVSIEFIHESFNHFIERSYARGNEELLKFMSDKCDTSTTWTIDRDGGVRHCVVMTFVPADVDTLFGLIT